MGLSKGKTNNPAGRPKGTPNRIGAELRERVIAFVEERWEQVERDFDDLEPRERMMFIERLMAYTLPKLQAVAVDYREHNQPEAVTVFHIPDNGRSFDPSKMTDEELQAIIERRGKRNLELNSCISLPEKQDTPQGEGYSKSSGPNLCQPSA